MREILFRGKRLDNGEWVEGYLGQYTLIGNNKTWLGYVIRSVPQKLWDCDWFEVDPATVGQFTGLRANGKRIFEGDIVEADWGKGVVKFLEGTFDSGIYRYNGWVIERDDGDVDHRALVHGSEVWMEPVVLGNIRDNPELLEVTPDE